MCDILSIIQTYCMVDSFRLGATIPEPTKTFTKPAKPSGETDQPAQEVDWFITTYVCFKCCFFVRIDVSQVFLMLSED